jgi:hypothetical protein
MPISIWNIAEKFQDQPFPGRMHPHPPQTRPDCEGQFRRGIRKCPAQSKSSRDPSCVDHQIANSPFGEAAAA